MEDDKYNSPDEFDEGDRKVELPEGWRVLDIKLLRRIDVLEQQTAKLFKHMEGLFKLIKSGQEWMDAQDEASQMHSRSIDKLFDGYYHIFPERFDQDNRVQSQLNALESTPKHGAKPKKI